ncbi:hypothetical protein DDZ18_03755 [Marinicauda salina]|uniref:Type II secretion system protein GspF domain-containing protein n=1 Tax=Marinicauda salina TaxID=2135793 RepID=A0A2U2BXJ2_9PROT|nr:type II secretion system F family protein [Marinicauda salina]PWE18717.1 hypothetical protein DDZ18_03755 [Marinicauda salina]
MTDGVSWRYVAEARDGRTVKGRLPGASEQAVADRLRADGLRPVLIRQARGRLFGSGPPRLSPKQYARVVRSLADLLGSGIPLRDALAMLVRREKDGRTKALLSRLEARVSAGDSLTAALRADPLDPPRLLPAISSAGEASGELAASLDQLASQMEADQAVRAEITGQLVYPAALLALIFATLVFLAWFVLPQFDSLFANTGAPPPPETAAILAAGKAIRAAGLWIALAVLLGLLGGRRVLEARPGVGDRIAGAIPVMRGVRAKLDTARYCRSLSLLLAAGQPLARAEPVARSAVASPIRRAALVAAGERLRSGQSFASALRDEAALPEEIAGFVELGEKTGRLAALLARAADIYESEARQTLKRTVELLGPAMTAILGLFVAAVIASVISGVLSLNEVVY